MSNQEGRVYRQIDETQNSPRRAQGSAEVDGFTGPQNRDKYRIGKARGKGKEGDRSRMPLQQYSKANKYGLQVT